jgi:hypothetical protein
VTQPPATPDEKPVYDYAERTRLWMLDAKALLDTMRKYEREHPPVEEGVPCLAKAEGALMDAIEKASRYAVHATPRGRSDA